MPSGWSHGFYFVSLSTVVPPPIVSGKGGYPLWQASNSAVGSLFGGLQALWEWACRKVRIWLRLQQQTVPVPAAKTPLSEAERLLNHPAYPYALEAVRRTAVTLGFNRPEAWQGLSRQMKASPGRAENTYRHLQACEWTRQTAPSTLTNPDCNLLVELAYHEFALKGR
jgi:hypothetical protein